MVASSVTSCVLFTKSLDQRTNITVAQESVFDGPYLAAAEFKLGFESLTRTLQNIICPLIKICDVSYFELVEKFHTRFTKVSYKYLFSLQFFHDREEYLFIDLRRLLI